MTINKRNDLTDWHCL